MRKKVLSFILCIGMMLMLLPTSASAEGEVYFGDKFGITREEVQTELYSHEYDNFYLGTPYKGGNWMSPNGDRTYNNGVAGMNCGGFVGYVVHMCGLNENDFQNSISHANSNGFSAANNWDLLVKQNNLVSYSFYSKSAMLDSGVLERGDIILMMANYSGPWPYGTDNHIGIYWGDGYNKDDVLWHSTGSRTGVKGNQISKIIPLADSVIFTVIKIDSTGEYHRISAQSAEHGNISLSGEFARSGESVEVTVTPDEGYFVSDLVINGESLGSMDYVVIDDIQSDYSISATFKRISPFYDVETYDWYYDSVKYVLENGIMVGTSETTFEPNTTTNRGMIVTILYRLEGEPSVEGLSNFPDVPSDKWYANAVAWAKDKSISVGNGNGNFGAADDLTREQLATMFYRYAQMKGMVLESDTALKFTDSASVSSWAETAIKWCVENGIISGKGNNILDPQGKATRAEMATIIQRFGEKMS